MSISTQYQTNLGDAARGALLSVVANHPSTSINELRELVQDHPALGGLTLAELVSSNLKTARTSSRRTSMSSVSKSSSSKPGGRSEFVEVPTNWETRTEAGRTMFDRAVLQALEGCGGVNVSAEQIRAELGATPAQVRTSLNRQIEAGEVSFTGKARGTRYSVGE
jgi:hypothetical protein